MSKTTKKRGNVSAARTGSPRLCEWCAKNIVENCKMGSDTTFSRLGCGDKCDSGDKIRGVIVLDGDRSKLIKRIQWLIEDAGNAEPCGGNPSASVTGSLS